MSARAQPTTPRRTELPALLALSFAALAAAAAVDELDADDDESDELDEPSELPDEEEVGDGELVPFAEPDGRVRLEPLPYGAEPEIPDAPAVAEGRTLAAPVAFEGVTGEVGAEPSLAEPSVPVELESVVLTSVSPFTMDWYEPVRSP